MRRIASVIALLAALATPALAQERLRVVATTSDLRSLAKAVGQERVIVSNLVPAGKRVEEYQLRLTDVAILKGAHVVMRAGRGIDPWFDRLLARAAQKEWPDRHRARTSPAISTPPPRLRATIP